MELFCQGTLISFFQMKRCRSMTDWHARPMKVVISRCLSTWRQCFTPVFSFKELQRKFSKIRRDKMELYKSSWLFPLLLLYILYTIVTSSGWLEYWCLEQCFETTSTLSSKHASLHKDTKWNIPELEAPQLYIYAIKIPI